MVKRRRISAAEKKEQKRPDDGANCESHEVKDEASEAGCDGGADAGACGLKEGSKAADPSSTTKDGAAAEGAHPSGGAGKIPPAPTRTSARLIKRPRRDLTPPAPSPPKKPVAKQAPPVPENKTRIWETEDKDVFFEAMYEHGKDFDAIQSLIAAKSRRRLGSAACKTKDQIRHFYYNTWHKIAKYIDGVEDVKNKHAMEMYALINYGELRRKIGGKLDEKRGQKLNELVHKGNTVVKIRGKTHRLKTPLCRALKRLNNMEENKEEEVARVPQKIVLELRPHSNAAWADVQSMAQNPRLRLTLRPGKRVTSVVEFLEKKWQPSRIRIKQSLGADEEPAQELCLLPPAGTKFQVFDLQPIPPQPIITLALQTYLEHVRSMSEGTSSPPNKKVCRRTQDTDVPSTSTAGDDGKTASKQSHVDSVSPRPVHNDASVIEVKEEENSSAGHPEGANGVATAGSAAGSAEGEVKQEPLSTREIVESLGVADVLPNFGKDEPEPPPEAAVPAEKEVVPDPPEIQELEKYRAGWRSSSLENMTIAELYLLMGSPETVVLEYEWRDKPSAHPTPIIPTFNSRLHNMLRRLVHLASTQFKELDRNKQASSAASSSPPCCTCGKPVSGTPPSRGAGKGRHLSPAGSVKDGQNPGTPRGPGRPSRAGTPKSKPPVPETMPTPSTAEEESQPSENGVFRVPNGVPFRPHLNKISPTSQQEHNFLQQIDTVNQRPDIFLPRRRRLNRNVRKPLVVQRTLLPKSQVPSRQMMTIALAKNGSFLPVSTNHLFMNNNKPVNSIQMIPVRSQLVNRKTLNVHSNVQTNLSASQAAGQPTPVINTQLLPPPSHRPQPITVQTPDGQAVTLQPINVPPAAAMPPTSAAGMAHTPAAALPHTPAAGMSHTHAAAMPHTPAMTPPVVSPSGQHLDMPLTLEAGSPEKHPGQDLLTALPAATSTPAHGVLARQSVQDALSGSSTVTSQPPLDVGLNDTATNMSSFSSYLDTSLAAADVSVGASDKLIDLALENSNASFSSVFLENFKEDTNMSTAGKEDATNRCHSPLKDFTLGKDWPQTDELSLSAFLSETPVKKPPDIPSTLTNPPLMSEHSRDSFNRALDMDHVLFENSMDYVSKFADLAAQLRDGAAGSGGDIV